MVSSSSLKDNDENNISWQGKDERENLENLVRESGRVD